MRIYSAPSFSGISGEKFYDINLPDIGRMFWQAPSTIAEAPFLATSTAPAGVYRQLTKYDVSAIKKRFTVVLSAADAATAQAMEESKQTEWRIDIGSAVYNCIATFGLSYASGVILCQIDVSVLEKVR